MENHSLEEDEEDGSLVGHPYGVLPNGNELLSLSSFSSSCRNGGGKPQEACVYFEETGDDIWVNSILVYCDGMTLGRVVQVCRYLYVVGHVPTLWRDVVLSIDKNTVLTNCHGGWKDTYVRLDSSSNSTNHVPMRISNMYSDTLFHYHSCANFPIPTHWYKKYDTTTTKNNSVPFVDYTQQQHQEEDDSKNVLQLYERDNRPLVLTNVSVWSNDIILSEWTMDKIQQMKEYSTIPLRSTSGAASHSAQFTLAGYETYCSSNIHREEAPLYLFDRDALRGKCPTLTNVYQSNFHKISQPFGEYHDLFHGLGDTRRPDHTWLIAGPKRSGSLFHVDPNATHAWNVCITGKKRWIFYAPHLTPPGVHPSSNGESVTMPLSLGEWMLQYHSTHQQLKKQHPTDILECTVGPGDLVFVPHGWWHAVINIAEGMNLAVTHNYVSTTNLPTVLRFLQTKQELISGCRDRPNEAIQPSQLYKACTDLWKQTLPSSIYDKAMLQSQQGWTNAAWSDYHEDQDDDTKKKQKLSKQNRWKRKQLSHHTASKKKSNTTTAGKSIISLAKSSSSCQSTNDNNEEKKEEPSIFQFSFL